MSNQNNDTALATRVADGIIPAARNEAIVRSAGAIERERALIESKMTVARRYPRNMDDVLTNLKKALTRPLFVKGEKGDGKGQTARFNKPVGGGVKGWSVRFSEEVARCMGNLEIDTVAVDSDDEAHHYKTTVVDYENNLTFSSPVVVPRTVERSKLDDGRRPVGQRRNSNGEAVYLVIATSDELLSVRNAQISKAKRNAILQHVPGWVLDECKQVYDETMRQKIAADPDGERRLLVEAFAELGVTSAMLTEVVGHPLDTITVKEQVELRAAFVSVKDGDLKWSEYAASKGVGAAPVDDAGAKKVAATIDKAKAEVAAKQRAKEDAKRAGVGKPKGESPSEPTRDRGPDGEV